MTYTPAEAKLRRLIARQSPENNAAAGADFERRYRANPDDRGIRITYFRLVAAVSKQFPIARPEPTEPPAEAWEDEHHPYWTTDPECVFNAAFDKLIEEIGHVNAIVKLSKMQADGEKFPA